MTNQKKLLSRADVLAMASDWEIQFPNSSQDRRVLATLSVLGSLTTEEMRRHLYNMHPAACIKSLRQQGHVILTKAHPYKSRTGRIRRMARYEFVGTNGDSQ
jgi:hypothetical protein